MAQPALLHVGQGRDPGHLAEAGMEVTHAQRTEGRQLLDANFIGQAAIHPGFQARQVEAIAGASCKADSVNIDQRFVLQMQVDGSQHQRGDFIMQPGALLELQHQSIGQLAQPRWHPEEPRPLKQARDGVGVAKPHKASHGDVQHQSSVATIAAVVVIAGRGNQAAPPTGDAVATALHGQLCQATGCQNQLVMVMGVSDMLTAQGFSPYGKFFKRHALLS